MATKTEIVINPELPIGTEFWLMEGSRVSMGLIAAYDVHVTSHTTNTKGWRDQLFERWAKAPQNHVFIYSYSYQVKLNSNVRVWDLKKDFKGNWSCLGNRIYFTKKELLDNL